MLISCRRNTLLTATVLTLFACKKEDNTPPQISITTPLAASTHDVFDYITVSANVSDNKTVEKVKIYILDPSGVNAVNAWETYPNQSSASVTHTFHLNNIHLPSGNYSIRVEAFDENNQKTAFREIYVNEEPRALKRIMITRATAGNVYIDSLSGSSFNTFYTVAGDYNGAAICSYWQQMYLQGSETSPLVALQVEDVYQPWSVAAQPNGTLPFFNRLSFDPVSTFVYSSNGYGYVRGYNKSGLMLENILSPGGRLPFNVIESGSYLIIEHRDIVASNHLLGVHYKNSGGSTMQTFPHSFKWAKMQTSGTDKIILAGNNGAQGELRVYNIPANTLFEPVNIPAGKIFDMVKIDSDNYLIAHASGILRYTYSNSNLINITNGNAAQRLAYDVTLGLVVAAEGNVLSAYHPVTGSLSFSHPATDSIRDILLLFNK